MAREAEDREEISSDDDEFDGAQSVFCSTAGGTKRGPGGNADLLGLGADSQSEDDPKKAKGLSGAAKKRRRKEKEKAHARSSQASGSADDDSDGSAAFTLKEKTCETCPAKNTDEDDVFKRVSARRPGAGKKRKLPRRMRWEKADGRGGCCYYCARVHERRYPSYGRKKLKEHLKAEPKTPDEASNRDKFDAEREKCVDLLAAGEGDRLPSAFATMQIDLPTQRVTQTTGKYERNKRKGKKIRMDVFIRMFPDKDPKKAGKIFDKKDENGVARQWVKMYNDEEGIEDFSEGSEERVEKETIVDDGSLVLSDTQMDDQFNSAAALSLTGSSQSGFTRADLGLATDFTQPMVMQTPDKRKKNEEKQVAADGSQGSSSDDGAAPMQRSLRKTTPKSKEAKKKDEAQAAKSLEKCVKLAVEFPKKVHATARRLHQSAEEKVSELADDLHKLVLEVKAVQVQVLIKGQKLEVAQNFNNAVSAAKAMDNYVKKFALLKKARVEGRTTKQAKAGSKNNPETQYLEAEKELIAQDCDVPVWGFAAKKSMEVDAGLAVDQYVVAVECITIDKVKTDLRVDEPDARRWMDQWARDILVATLKSKDAAIAKQNCKTVMDTLLKENLYPVGQELKKDIEFLQVLVDPEKFTVDRVHACTESIARERSQKNAFWMLIMDQAGAKALAALLKTASQTLGKEEDFNATYGKLLTVFRSLVEKLKQDDVDKTQIYEMFKEHAPLVAGHILALVKESPRANYLASRVGPVKELLEVCVTVALDLDELFVFPCWHGLACERDSWKVDSEGANLQAAIAKNTFFADFLCRLKGMAMSSHIKKGELLAGISDRRLAGWEDDLNFRQTVCMTMQHSKSLVAILPAEVPENRVCESHPEVFPKLVEVCRYLSKADFTLQTIGAPGSFMNATIAQKLTACLDAVPKAIVGKWTKPILDEKVKEFEKTLCKAKFPQQQQDRFLPPGQAEDELKKYADCIKSNNFADHVSLLYASVDCFAEQAACLVEGCISNMQAWAAKLLIVFASLPTGSINLKSLSVDQNAFVALKTLKADAKRAKEIIAGGQVQEPQKERYTRVLSEATAFIDQKCQAFEDCIVKLIVAGAKICKQHTPDWRPSVLENENPQKIKTELVDSKLIQALRSAYPTFSQLVKDIDAVDLDLELRLRLKRKDELKELEDAVAEAKLSFGIEHICNVIYVLGPLAKGPKAKSGLLRELNAKLKRAELTCCVPAELLARANKI